MEFWLDGHFSGLDLAAYEAKYNYRYRLDLAAYEAKCNYHYSYYHRGTSASWVSRHNFAVIDVSAGPVLFGPQTSPGGKLEPPSVPRILPGLMKMANEMADAASGPSSARREIIRQASLGGSMLLQGQLAACVSAAVRHVFVPDLRFERLEHARNVLVPLIALYDDPAHDPLDNDTPSYRRVMHDDVEGALRILLDPGQSGFVESRSKRLQDYPAIASALHKARVSRSDAVLLSGEGGAGGVHTSARVHVDAATLLRELQMAIPSLSDGTLTLDADDAASRTASWELPQLRGHARHDGTRVLPVFILTLTCSPEQMLFDNRQLVAADHDSVVVLQLVRPGSDDDDDVDADGSVFSGHVLDGLPLRMDAAGGLTANVLAGVAMGLAGIVPPYERHDASGSVVQDWRWGVGALPWGPHAHSFELSRVYSGVAKRNFFISHLELAKSTTLDQRVVRSVFEGEDVAAHVPTDPRSRLGALASMSPLGGYNTTFPENVMGQLEVALGEVESGLQAVTWDLWSQDWDAAQASLEHVLAAVDLFTKRADADLVAANAAAECCRLDHSSGTAWSWVVGELSWVVGELELGVELLAVGALALLIAACMAVGLVRSTRPQATQHITMRRVSLAVVVLLGAAVLLLGSTPANSAALSSPVLLVDSADGAYLHAASQGDVTASAEVLPSLVSALCGLLPPGVVDSGASDVIGALVKPSPLRKPKAHVVLNVASLSEAELASIFGSRSVRQLQLEGMGSTVEATSESLSSIAFSNPELSVTMLDLQGLASCTGNCLDEHLASAASAMGATLMADGSRLNLPGGGSLDLSALPDKLFAVEAASLTAGVAAQLAHSSPDGRADEVTVLEATLVGIAGVEAAYGRDSATASGARSVLVALLQAQVVQLDAKYGGDVTYQAAAFSAAGRCRGASGASDVMGWKAAARRALLDAEPWPPTDQVAASKKFASKAAAYGGFLVVLYFSIAAVWCMVYMPFKQDTLLFGAKKQE
ncbi:hypothetical protein FOA52_007326 [Chlamydomonas sp. UWO 241]|nr:hypothetical protein FOA52_007326 [Chlamydomonas sp. UWO 241]